MGLGSGLGLGLGLGIVAHRGLGTEALEMRARAWLGLG